MSDTTLDDANIDSGQEGGDSKKEIMVDNSLIYVE